MLSVNIDLALVQYEIWLSYLFMGKLAANFDLDEMWLPIGLADKTFVIIFHQYSTKNRKLASDYNKIILRFVYASIALLFAPNLRDLLFKCSTLDSLRRVKQHSSLFPAKCLHA